MFNVSKILMPSGKSLTDFQMSDIDKMETHGINNDVIDFLTIARVKINAFKTGDEIDPVWGIP